MIRGGQSEHRPGLSPGDVHLRCVGKSCLLSLTLSTCPCWEHAGPISVASPVRSQRPPWKGACAEGAEWCSFSITPLLFSLWPFFLPLSSFTSSQLMTLRNTDWVAHLCPVLSVWSVAPGQLRSSAPSQHRLHLANVNPALLYKPVACPIPNPISQASPDPLVPL